MSSNLHGYACPIPAEEFRRIRDEQKKLFRTIVHPQSLVEELVKHGWSEPRAIQQANFCTQIGCWVLVGDVMMASQDSRKLFTI